MICHSSPSPHTPRKWSVLALLTWIVVSSSATAQHEFVPLTIANNSDPTRLWTDGSSPEAPAVRSQDLSWTFQANDSSLRVAVEFLHLDLDAGCLLLLTDAVSGHEIVRLQYEKHFASFDDNLLAATDTGFQMLPFGFPWFASSSSQLHVSWVTEGGAPAGKGFSFRYSVVPADWRPEWVTHDVATLTGAPTLVDLATINQRAIVRVNDSTSCHWDLTLGAEGISGPFAQLGEVRVFREAHVGYYAFALGSSVEIDEFSSMLQPEIFDRFATYYAVLVRERADVPGVARVALRASQQQGHAQVVAKSEWKPTGALPGYGRIGSAYPVNMSAEFQGSEYLPPGYYSSVTEFNVIHFVAAETGTYSFQAESMMDFRPSVSASGVVTEALCDTVLVEIVETKPGPSELFTVPVTTDPQSFTDGSRPDDLYSSRYNLATYTWQLRAPSAGERIQLEFTRFALTTNAVVRIFDGPDTTAPEIAVLGFSPAFNSHHNFRGFPYFWSTGQYLTVFFSVCVNTGGCIPHNTDKGFTAVFSLLPPGAPFHSAVLPMVSGVPKILTIDHSPGETQGFQYAQLAPVADAHELHVSFQVLNGTVGSGDRLSIGTFGAGSGPRFNMYLSDIVNLGYETTYLLTGTEYATPFAVLLGNAFDVWSPDRFSIALTLTYRTGPARVTINSPHAGLAAPIIQVALASAPQQILFELSGPPFAFVAPVVGMYNFYARGLPKAGYTDAEWFAADATRQINAHQGAITVNVPFAVAAFDEDPSVLAAPWGFSNASWLGDGSLPNQPAPRAGEFVYKWLIDARAFSDASLRLQFDSLDMSPLATLRVYRGQDTQAQLLVELGAAGAGDRAVASRLARFPDLAAVDSSTPLLVEYTSLASHGAPTTGLGWKLWYWAEPSNALSTILGPQQERNVNDVSGGSIIPSAPISTVWFQTSPCATNFSLAVMVKERPGSSNAVSVSVTRLGVTHPARFTADSIAPLLVPMLEAGSVLDSVRPFPGSEIIVDVTYPDGQPQSAPVLFTVALEHHVLVPVELNLTMGGSPLASHAVLILDARGIILANETSNLVGLILVQLPEGRFRLTVPDVSAEPVVLDIKADPKTCSTQTIPVAFEPRLECPPSATNGTETCACANLSFVSNPEPWTANLGRELGPDGNATGLTLRDANSAIWFADGNSMHSDAATGAIISPQELVIRGVAAGASIRQLQQRLHFLETQLSATFSASESSCVPAQEP